MSKKIYRIENIETGNGPYADLGGGGLFDFFDEDAVLVEMNDRHEATRPVPRKDFEGDFLNENYCFACRNMTALRRWFGKYFNYLVNDTFDFVVYEYEVKEFVNSISGKQIAFINNEENILNRKRVLPAFPA